MQYFGSSIPALSSDGLPQTLKTIERELVVLRTQYTDKDESIIRLLEQRNSTINLLKSRAIKYLKIAKLEAEARMEAAMRPKGVLLKYKELLRELMCVAPNYGKKIAEMANKKIFCGHVRWNSSLKGTCRNCK